MSWNIQWACGVDGVVDPRRIVDGAQALAGGELDLLCLQEVVAHYPELRGRPVGDQFDAFADLLPGWTAVPGIGVDVAGSAGQRRRFGNLLLSRLPVLRVLNHPLPWPADPASRSMPRAATFATVAAPFGPLVVVNTHLEHFSAAQRAAQVDALRALHAANAARAPGSRVADEPGSPYHAGAASTRTLIAGDFNLRPDDPLHACLGAPFDDGITPRLVDAWRHLHGDAPHPPNVGLYDRSYFREPQACDFFYASEDLLPRLRRVEVDGRSRASDHQPLLLELA